MDETLSDEVKRRALLAEFEQQGGVRPLDIAGAPLVSLEMFFEGNRDLGSIGCNLWEHPGVEAFRETLLSIRGRDDVQDVLVAITDVEPETEGVWPFSDTVFILSSAPPKKVAKWLKKLQPDEVGPVPEGMAAPGRLPQPLPGHKLYMAWWD